jgi:hypothetical protein
MKSFSRYLETNKEFLTSDSNNIPEEYCGVNINYLKEYMSKELNAYDFKINFDKKSSFPLKVEMKFNSDGVVDGTFIFRIAEEPIGGDTPREVQIEFEFLGIRHFFQSLYITEFKYYDTNRPKDNNYIARAAVEDLKKGMPSAINKSLDDATMIGNIKSLTGQGNVPLEKQEEIIKSDPKYIRYIDHPDKKIQDKVVAHDRMNFLLIKNPYPELEKKYKYLRSIKKAGIIK